MYTNMINLVMMIQGTKNAKVTESSRKCTEACSRESSVHFSPRVERKRFGAQKRPDFFLMTIHNAVAVHPNFGEASSLAP